MALTSKRKMERSGAEANLLKEVKIREGDLPLSPHNVIPECKGNWGKTMGREVMKMNILEKLEDGGVAKIKGYSERHIQATRSCTS